MIIEKVDAGRECFSGYSLEGTVLDIGGVIIDLAEEEGDQEVVISFGKCNGMVHRGLKPCCVYVAEVVIPPRKYMEVEKDGPPEEWAGEEEPETHTETVPAPLDINSVTLKVWPVESRMETNQMGENENAE
jgi:hypothetical protein